ncbi:hypothetical protein EXD98_18265 [Acinetobacter pittii]|uniref:Uncharacterized protein n=1 Tax=Acinetobacter pittii TaxID=48296 RepID=A0AAE8KES1_ACIPI|nr:hypothetical protein [Acinetobacter pittii]RZH25213.1 hypothetical protein EXD98_18265 [Acinetobacter pittii]
MPQCDECGDAVEKIHRRYKQRNYCHKCYVRFFKKRDCPSCGKSSRLHKADNLAVCQQCETNRPCIRCQRIDYFIGRITEQGPVCNSCSVYFREFQACERCGVASQRLSRISRFEDNLRVCPKCATRDYQTCKSCRRYRLVKQDILSGKMLCKKCLSCPPVQCLTCQQQIPAGYGKYCESCSWRRILGNRIKELIQTLVNPSLKGYFKEYMNWLDHELGPHKAALLIRKHIQFFEKTNDLWRGQIPDYDLLLLRLRASGLRKYELPIRWLVTVHHLHIDTQAKGQCSEFDQLKKLANSCSDSLFSDYILQNYYHFLRNKIDLGKTSIRSARLAMKPASALMLLVSQSRLDLPTMWHVKYYLFKSPGQAAAIVGFLNFLNKNYDTNLDTSWVSEEKMTKKINMKKLEKKLLALMMCPKEYFSEKNWIALGLKYFHNLDKFVYNQIDCVGDGFNIYIDNNIYWIPKV